MWYIATWEFSVFLALVVVVNAVVVKPFNVYAFIAQVFFGRDESAF